MKLLALALLAISCIDNTVPVYSNTNDPVALKSARVIELHFLSKDPTKKHLKWFYEAELADAQDELSKLITK